MKHLQQILQNFNENSSHNLFVFLIFAVKSALYEFDIPVTEMIPDQIVNLLGSSETARIFPYLP